MKSKLIKIGLTQILLFVLLTACSPWNFNPKFDLQNKAEDNYLDNIECKILSENNTYSVDTYARNAFILDTASKVAIRVRGWTMHDADVTVELKEGDGIKFYTRSAAYQNPTFQNITFDFTIYGSRLKENGVLVKDFPEIKAKKGEKTRIVFRNDGTHLRIFVDCDEIIDYTTTLFSTEYLIIESYQNSRADFTGVHFEELY